METNETPAPSKITRAARRAVYKNVIKQIPKKYQKLVKRKAANHG